MCARACDMDTAILKLSSLVYCSAVKNELSNLRKKNAFGGSLDLDLLGIEIEERTLVPGVAVASARAKPLAGMCFWKYIFSLPYINGNPCYLCAF